MPEKLTVLFLPHPLDPSMFKPWGEDVVAAIGDRHNLKILDYNQPIAPQFEGVEVVIDQGGSAGTREMADAAAGEVRLWQILWHGGRSFRYGLLALQENSRGELSGTFQRRGSGRMRDDVHSDACAAVSYYPGKS